ncbi:MAG: carbohydrate ABC transporter permease [Verrucomicrobiota bacterium]
MPILGSIQRKSPNGRLILAGMYFFLTIGSISMIYPVLLMLSGSVKSDVDIRRFDVFPQYLRDEKMLFRKFEEQRYGGQMEVFLAGTMDQKKSPIYSFEALSEEEAVSPSLMKDWKEFMEGAKQWPRHFLQLGHNYGRKTVPEVTYLYQQALMNSFPTLSKKELMVMLKPENWQERGYQSPQGPFGLVYTQLRESLEPRYFRPTPINGHFIVNYLTPHFGVGEDAIQKLNQSWGTQYASLSEVVLPEAPPENKEFQRVWWDYVRGTLSSRFVHFSTELQPAYGAFLKTRYKEISVLNEIYGENFRQWSEATFPGLHSRLVAYSDLDRFMESLPAPQGLTLDAPEFRWKRFLVEKYGSDLGKLKISHGQVYSGFQEVPMPIMAYDRMLMNENKRAIVCDFMTRNYKIVWNYISVQGRALQNTIIFCVLSVLTALIVNPLAAYALSRFQPQWGYKALFLLMATMAFPAEVTQIPSFLLLREFGLLNTFAALVLPAAANGYAIFLLKGFFDSLPKELYESANLDGASELRIFFTITLPLSQPILAVVALGAFTASYGAFMFALLVCQKESMWTLMVYIYQLQQNFSTPIVFASLVLAAIPTLLVFVFCQNIIMRGVVVPVEK